MLAYTHDLSMDITFCKFMDESIKLKYLNESFLFPLYFPDHKSSLDHLEPVVDSGIEGKIAINYIVLHLH